MSEAGGELFDSHWYRVADMRPRLRPHVQAHRHDYRGQIWYVVQDHGTGRFQRFSPAAYLLIGLMDGQRTVNEIWEISLSRLGDDAPTQGEFIRLLGHLHGADVLQTDVPPDTDELLRRHHRIRRSKVAQNLKTPLAFRIPLVDPERFLDAVMPTLRPLFGWFGVVLWLAVVGAGMVLAALHWPELTEGISDRVLSPSNLVLLAVVFPLVKALHELGHALMVKAFGGEVHEMGVMFLVFMPIPYVDATAASAFREKRKRMLVGAAGMITELFLAGLAMLVWINVEPGPLRAVAYNVMLIASVSTLVFNGNPLLRFDAYYIFADWIEIPNLASRSMKYLRYLIQRYGFGMKDVENPASAPGERAWFVFYALASFAYRIFLYAVIILFVASQFFFIGVLLAAWAAVSMVIAPLFKGLKFVLTDRRLKRHRRRAVVVTSGFIALVAGTAFALPVPSTSTVEGVLWVRDEALLRPGTDGFVAQLLVEPGETVRRGQPVLQVEEPLLRTSARVLQRQLEELEIRYAASRVQDRVQAAILREEIAGLKASLGRARERLEGLTVLAPTDGTLVVPRGSDLPGRYLSQGDAVGYVVDADEMIVRAVVPQDRIDLVRQRTRVVTVRLAGELDTERSALVQREVPGASAELPSAALGVQGGGRIALDPGDRRGRRAFERLFHFELVLGGDPPAALLGERAYVRFDHGREPLATQGYRALRQLLLRQFNV